MKMITSEDISQLQEEVDDKISTYLIEKGWTHTCQTPGSYWVWVRKFKNGEILMAGKNLAKLLQTALDVMPDYGDGRWRDL